MSPGWAVVSSWWNAGMWSAIAAMMAMLSLPARMSFCILVSIFVAIQSCWLVRAMRCPISGGRSGVAISRERPGFDDRPLIPARQIRIVCRVCLGEAWMAASPTGVAPPRRAR